MNQNDSSLQNRLRNPKNGFSLIEVLVSLSIFAVVITIAIGALMALIGANARTQNTQAVMTNVSYALDSMTREIRTGNDFFCGTDTTLPKSGTSPQDCSSGGSAFAFNEGGKSLTAGFPSTSRIGFRLNDATIERRLGTGTWDPVTAPEIEITKLRFVVTGTTRGDTVTPTVTIFVSGTAGEKSDKSQVGFNIQTTIAQQLLDI